MKRRCYICYIYIYVGLYRDDGLAVIKNSSGSAIERIRKMITKLFQQHSLQITSQCNLKRTDFLDVCLDLENGTYCPYRKRNDVPLYINTNSNHPPIIKKQLTAHSCPQNIGTIMQRRDVFQGSSRIQ